MPPFFPVSFGLFLILFLGKNHIFFWHDNNIAVHIRLLTGDS
jgi:hypothetical protein